MTYKSTVTPPRPRRIGAYDNWLTDPTTGSPVGVQNTSGSGEDAYFNPVELTAAQIASPTEDMLAAIEVTYRLNEEPYTRYMSNGTTLVGLESGGGVDTNPVGIFANLATVPAGTPALTVGANSQALIWAPWTIQNAAGVTVLGELRVYNWL